MCASRDELRPRYQRRTAKGFDDSNADHPESSSSSDELNRALRALSGSPKSQSQNRGLPEQGTSQAAGKKAGKPINDATSVTEDSRRRAHISELNLSIKGQQPTNHNPIDDLGRKGENYGTAREVFKIQNPRVNSGDSRLGKFSRSKYRATLSADSNVPQRENSEIRKEMGQGYLAQQTGKSQSGNSLFQQFPSQEERDEDERRGGKRLPFEGEHASDTISLMETIPCKEPVRLLDRLEVSGQHKSIKDPICLANNSVKEIKAGVYEIKEGQRCKGKEGNDELVEVSEIFPCDPIFPLAVCLFPEEEGASVVNHTISVGSSSREANQRDRAKIASVIFNGTDACPMQVDPDEPKSFFPFTSDTIQQNPSLRKRKKWARQARSNSCSNTTKVDPSKRKFKEDAGETQVINSKKQRKLEIDNGVPTELQVVLDPLTQTAEAAVQPCRSS
ncbi:hypothetical protein U1Q18_040447 [Sarracenia purpurea var. burkii]